MNFYMHFLDVLYSLFIMWYDFCDRILPRTQGCMIPPKLMKDFRLLDHMRSKTKYFSLKLCRQNTIPNYGETRWNIVDYTIFVKTQLCRAICRQGSGVEYTDKIVIGTSHDKLSIILRFLSTKVTILIRTIEVLLFWHSSAWQWWICHYQVNVINSLCSITYRLTSNWGTPVFI